MREAYKTTYGQGIAIRLVVLATTALLSDCSIKISRRKSLEFSDQTHVVTLMDKEIFYIFGRNDFSLGFERSNTRRRGKQSNRAVVRLPLTFRETIHLKIESKYHFGFGERQKNEKYCLG